MMTCVATLTKVFSAPVVAESLTRAALATGVSTTKLRFDDSGNAPSEGYAVTKPGSVSPSAVRFMDSAAAPSGTGNGAPASGMVVVDPPWGMECGDTRLS